MYIYVPHNSNRYNAQSYDAIEQNIYYPVYRYKYIVHMIYVLTASDKGLFRLHPIQNQETKNNTFTPKIYLRVNREGFVMTKIL